MNKILSKIANDKKLSALVVLGGLTLSAVSNIALVVGVYYSGVRKGVEVMTVEVEVDDE